MKVQRRSAKGAAAFCITLALGLAAWSPLSRPFSAGFAHAANAALGSLPFGAAGHARFARAADPSWSCAVGLQIDGFTETTVIALSPRRLAYLPLLFFAACIAAAPLPKRRKLFCVLCGVPLLSAITLGSVWITLTWIFSQLPAAVYPLTPFETAALRSAVDGLVGQMGNKLVYPLIVAILLISWQSSAERRAARIRVRTLDRP